jgi:hypothetical protein
MKSGDAFDVGAALAHTQCSAGTRPTRSLIGPVRSLPQALHVRAQSALGSQTRERHSTRSRILAPSAWAGSASRIRPRRCMSMKCLNGFFHFPPMNSLAEELLKAEGKGAIAAFAPSGLSVDEAAHL